MTRKHARYLSPFASPVWLPVDEAERILAHDDRLYLRMVEVGAAEELRPPRLEHIG